MNLLNVVHKSLNLPEHFDLGLHYMCRYNYLLCFCQISVYTKNRTDYENFESADKLYTFSLEKKGMIFVHYRISFFAHYIIVISSHFSFG